MKLAAFLIPILFLAGCAQKPVRVKPISFAQVEAKHAAVETALLDAKNHGKAVSSALDQARAESGRAKQSIAYQREALERVKPKVADLVRVAPPDLRDLVEGVQAEVVELDARTSEAEAANTATETAQETAVVEQRAGNAAVARAEGSLAAAKEELRHRSSEVPALVAAANHNADVADAAQKDAAHKGNIIGWALGLAAAALATRFINSKVPWTWALPAIAFPIGYALGRFL
jgi:hypothetical protein